MPTSSAPATFWRTSRRSSRPTDAVQERSGRRSRRRPDPRIDLPRSNGGPLRERPMTRILDAIHLVLKVLLATLIAGLIVPVTMQILSRFTGIIPRYIWTEEIARFCFVWMIMIGAMCAVRDGTHFDLDVLPRVAQSQGRGRETDLRPSDHSLRRAGLRLVRLDVPRLRLVPDIGNRRTADELHLRGLADFRLPVHGFQHREDCRRGAQTA